VLCTDMYCHSQNAGRFLEITAPGVNRCRSLDNNTNLTPSFPNCNPTRLATSQSKDITHPQLTPHIPNYSKEKKFRMAFSKSLFLLCGFASATAQESNHPLHSHTIHTTYSSHSPQSSSPTNRSKLHLRLRLPKPDDLCPQLVPCRTQCFRLNVE
jgi:hypothetical protein